MIKREAIREINSIAVRRRKKEQKKKEEEEKHSHMIANIYAHTIVFTKGEYLCVKRIKTRERMKKYHSTCVCRGQNESDHVIHRHKTKKEEEKNMHTTIFLQGEVFIC